MNNFVLQYFEIVHLQYKFRAVCKSVSQTVVWLIMIEFKKSLGMLATFLLISANLYAANPIDGKTIIFFNYWEEDGVSETNGFVPQVGENIYSYGNPQVMDPAGAWMTDLPYINNWYSHTFGGATNGWANDFKIFIELPGSDRTNSIQGPGVSAWAGKDTLYAAYDPVTDQMAYSSERPRFVRLLNPWPVSAPGISVNGSAPGAMYRNKDRCGWYFYPVFGDVNVNVYFQDINFGDSYGLNGLTDATPFALQSHFASNINAYITPRPIPEGAPELTSDYPADSPAGDCFYKLAATVRDFNSRHPNFEFDSKIGDKEANNCNAGGATLGMVQTTLGADKKPVSTGPGKCNNSEFNTWFNDFTSPSNQDLSNASTCIDLQMDKAANGQWEIDSRYSTYMGFWPIDTFFVNNEVQLYEGEFYRDSPFIFIRKGENIPGQNYPIGEHNFHFCMETHAEFVYRKGQKFSFTGDDDVWAFINKQLVVDLGGIHAALDAEVDLDTLGLTEGELYDFDFFMCDRNTTGSNMKIKTSIYFDQKRGLFTEKINEINGFPEYTIKKVEESDESCAGQQSSGTSIIDNPLVSFRLTGNNTDTTLSQGVNFGGINITGPNSYWLDPEAITDLGPGSYQLIVQDLNNPTISFVVKISVPGNISIQNNNPETVLAGADPVMVIIQNERDGVINAEAVPYALSLGAGLEVFEDAAMTQATDLTTLTTGVTGLDTVYVWSPRSNQAPNTYSIRVIEGIGDPKEITFEIPDLRFIDASGTELTSFDLGQWTFVPNEVRAELFWSGGVCTQCVGDTVFFNNTDTLAYRLDPQSASVDYGLIDSTGKITFYVSSFFEVTDYEFTINGVSPSTEATYTGITLVDPPFPLVEVAEIRDVDGDGVADQVYVQYNKPIVDSLPSSFSYFWPDTNNVIAVDMSQISNFLINDSTLVFDGIVKDTVQTSGKGYVNSPYEFENVIVPTGRDLEDGMGPVVMSAAISVQGDDDIIIIRFSEEILADSAKQDQNWYNFIKSRNNVGPQSDFEYSKRNFSGDAKTHIISFSSLLPRENRAILGDSINLAYVDGQTGTLRDLRGNFASSTSRFVPILGEPRVEIVTLDSLISGDNTLPGKGEVTIQTIPVGTSINDIVSQTGQAGVIIPFEALQAELDELGVYDVRVKVQTNIFTNLGGFVINEDMTIACDSELFNGNCRDAGNQVDLFISWNYKDSDDRAVGSGVYIVYTVLSIERSVVGSGKWENATTIENYEYRGFRRIAN